MFVFLIVDAALKELQVVIAQITAANKEKCLIERPHT